MEVSRFKDRDPAKLVAILMCDSAFPFAGLCVNTKRCARRGYPAWTTDKQAGEGSRPHITEPHDVVMRQLEFHRESRED